MQNREKRQANGQEKRFYCLDRFEGAHAVLLLGETEEIVPRTALPEGAKEGDLLAQNDAAQGGYRLLTQETTARRAQMKNRLAAILKKNAPRP